MKEKVNFVALAEAEVEKFKRSFIDSHDSNYVDIPLFVAIHEDEDIELGANPQILKNAVECILILAYDKLEISNYYDWYEILYIDKEGVVHNGFEKDSWGLTCTFSGSYKMKIMFLNFKGEWISFTHKEGYLRWDDYFKKLWDIYRYVKSSETVKEARLMCKNYELLRKVDSLQKEIDELKSTNQLLEKQKMQCQSIINEIQTIIQGSNEN
jgi:cell fate (sporulation/competence/biofilm development) regulator YlbF (YheA/YmcA/DUF963 family)